MSGIIRTAYRRAWWALLLRGLFALAIGIVILWRPFDSIAAFALVIAWWAIFTGVIQLVQSFDLRTVYSRWWVLLLSGLVSVIFGVAALYYYPALSLAFAVLWVTWWLFVSGLFAILLGMMERRLGLSWGWALAFGLLCIVAGVFAIMYPPATLATIMGLIAAFAIISGALHLMGAFALSSLKADVADTLEDANAMPPSRPHS
jgi:uncharacterized membrane protein HdeD (DUF308 family)